MDYFTRKMYFSIIASTLIIITAATTSYAWYSSNQNAIVDRFNINIYNSDDKESESLKISITGEEDDFHQYLTEYEIKRAVLYNKIGVSETNSLGNGKTNQSKLNIDNMFNKIVKLSSATPSVDTNYKVDLTKGFTRFDLSSKGEETTDDIISFDLYIAVENEGTYVTEGTNVYINSYIENDIETNKIATSSDITCNLLTSLPKGGIDSITGNALVSENMTSFKVNAVNALRFGYTTFSAQTKGNVYESSSKIKEDIYALSSQDASCINDVYNFGGLDGDNNGYNAMLMYYKSLHPDYDISNIVPDYIKNRNDKYLYSSSSDKQIITKDFGLNTKTMIKVRFYFWLEGWDADCFNSLIDAKIDFSIYLSTIPYFKSEE